jgi:hypothetical protein
VRVIVNEAEALILADPEMDDDAAPNSNEFRATAVEDSDCAPQPVPRFVNRERHLVQEPLVTTLRPASTEISGQQRGRTYGTRAGLPRS